MKKNCVLILLILLLLPLALAQTTLTTEREIPQSLQIVTKILFGIEKTLTVSSFIVIIGLWLIALLIIADVLKFAPFFKGIKAWLGAVIISLIIGVSGGFKGAANFFLSIGDTIDIVGELPILTLVFTILILLVGTFLILYLLRLMRRKIEIYTNENKGMDAGAVVSGIRPFFKIWGKKDN
jgi:hypothetical protein